MSSVIVRPFGERDQRGYLHVGKVWGMQMIAKTPDNGGAVQQIQKVAPKLPIAHVILAPSLEETPWSDIPRRRGVWLVNRRLHNVNDWIHAVKQHFDENFPTIARAFLGNNIVVAHIARRFEENTPAPQGGLAGARNDAHFHVLMGHENLFGKDGLLRRSIDDALRPGAVGGPTPVPPTDPDDGERRLVA